MTRQPADASLTHRSVTYTVVPLDSVLETATRLQRARRRWHSHVLMPACTHNPYAGRFAVVVEDDEGRANIAASDVFPEVDRALVTMLHGDTILRRGSLSGVQVEAVAASAILERVADIDRQHAAWHHHMHFPRCALSPVPDHWTIAVESETGDFFEAYDAEPVDVLRELEVRFFSRLDSPGASPRGEAPRGDG